MTTAPFTFEQLKSKVIEILDSDPEFVYSEYEEEYTYAGQSVPHRRCFYVKDGRGSCIFGRALIDLGVQADYFEPWEDRGIDEILNDLEVEYTRAEKEWAIKVQCSQDRMIPYGQIPPNIEKD